MTVDIDSVRMLTDSIKAATERKPDGSTVSATVTETGSNVTWVRVDGSSGTTPVTESTVSVSVGDRVSVRIENGSATITGNLSNVSTGAAETRAAVEPVKAVAESAEQAAERATDYAATAKNAAQDAVQSAADAGRAAAVAQAAMGSTTVDWHDYRVEVGDDGQWHVFDKDGAEVPLSEISMVYQDALGLHILGESTRMDIDDDGLEIVNASDGGGVLASFGADGMILMNGKGKEIAHLGYGNTDDDSSARSPYFTLGGRRHVETSGGYSLAEGFSTNASGRYSHAEGYATSAVGNTAHAEGFGSRALGSASHAEGINTQTGADIYDGANMGSHAEGSNTKALGRYSHAQNLFTTAESEAQTAIGKYNDNKSTNAFEVGNGTSNSARSNAFECDWDGNVTASGNVTAVDMSASGNLTASNVTASGSVSAGGFSVGGNPLLKVEKVTDSARSVGASTATSWNVTLPTIDGYKPIGVVGFSNEGTSSTSMIPIRHRISGQSLYFAVRNASSSATSNLVYDYYILYAANGVL